MTSSPMSLLKSSTTAPASRNNTRQIKVLEELLNRTLATTLTAMEQENRRHIIMTARIKTLVEVMDSSPTRNGAERRKMTANTTISTRILAMNTQTLSVTSLMVPLTVSNRLAHSSQTTNKLRASRPHLTSNNLRLRAVSLFSQHTPLSAS